MITDNTASASAKSIPGHGDQHADFLPLKAKVERHARVFFRHLPATDREEATSDCVAVAFASFIRLKARGRNPSDFPSWMAHWAALIVMDGRQVSSTDVLCPRAQRRHGFRVESLTRDRKRQANTFEEMLQDNTRTPPSEQAAFRIDFTNWVAAHSHQDRQLIHELSRGERTSDLAQKYGITPGRVSQKRRQFNDAWQEFQGEQPADVNAAIA
jgi:hypothetical protein